MLKSLVTPYYNSEDNQTTVRGWWEYGMVWDSKHEMQ